MKKQRKIDKKRRRQAKTNYNKRLILLKGNSPRLVVRKTNKYLILQIIESKHAEDKVIYSANTKELLKFGWDKDKKGSLKSISAGYLGGLLLGKKAKGLKERVILDIGLIPNTKGSRVYAAVKGLADSGIEINYNDKIMPSKERIEGKHINIDIKPIINKIGVKIKEEEIEEETKLDEENK
jgi:large subunit ribosomal protein L18